MKTVKITLIAMVLLLANSTKAQTIEETEQWLNEYGKNITLSVVYEDGEEKEILTDFTGFDGEFLNFFISKDYSCGGGYQDTYKVLPKDILYQDISTFSENDFEDNARTKAKSYQLKAKSGKIFHSGKATNGINKYGRAHTYLYLGKSEIEQNTDLISFNLSKVQSTEALRLLKAIYHFAKLKGASDLPKVKKDTF